MTQKQNKFCYGCGEFPQQCTCSHQLVEYEITDPPAAQLVADTEDLDQRIQLMRICARAGWVKERIWQKGVSDGFHI
jgi:hypothetical protein